MFRNFIRGLAVLGVTKEEKRGKSGFLADNPMPVGPV
jgi:hypothetical protein